MHGVRDLLKYALPHVWEYVRCAQYEYSQTAGKHAVHLPELKAELSKLGMDFVGQGSYSVVFSCPWDTRLVVKFGLGLCHTGDLDDPWLAWALFCADKAGMPMIPAIDWLFIDPCKEQAEQYVVVAVMQKVRPLGDDYGPDHVEDVASEVYEAMYSGYRGCKHKIVAQHEREGYDLGKDMASADLPEPNDVFDDNLGLNDEGDIMVLDPCGGNYHFYEEDNTWIGLDGQRHYPSEPETVCGAVVKIAPQYYLTEVRDTASIASVAA